MSDSTDNFDAKRTKGGKATKTKYHKPITSDTPDIHKGSFRPDGGPQRDNKTKLGAKAYCYVHDAPHGWEDCPANPANKETE